MTRPGPAFGRRTNALKEFVERRRGELERHRLVAFPLAAYRRFREIEGKHLALVIGVNLFIAVIPLLIVGYAIIEAFNPNRSIGTVFVGRFHLSGDTARIVRATFTNAKGGKNVALSISLISLLITGIDVAGMVGTVYARAFQVSPPRGVAKVPARRRVAPHAARDDFCRAHGALLGVEPTVVVPRVRAACLILRHVRLLSCDTASSSSTSHSRGMTFCPAR